MSANECQDPPGSDQSQGALAGLRVVELASVLMAPYAGQLLGDLGAEVIKVEGDTIDPSRLMCAGPHPELSGVALNLHRNKWSVQLDLKQDAGRDAFLRLLDTADVLITNFRPGALKRLRLDYESVGPTRPRLIYCEAHGFGRGSDEGNRPAYDDIMQAETGLAALTEMVGDVMRFVPSAMVDKLCGLTIVYAILAAVIHRNNTGQGQQVEVAMFDAALAFNLVEHLAQAAVPGGSPGYARILTKHRGPHRTRDGYLAVMPYEDKHWRALYRFADREEDLSQPWFADHRARFADPDRVYGSLADVISERTTEEWVAVCTENGIPFGRVASIWELVADPARNRGLLTEQKHPVIGPYVEIGPPVRYERTPMSVRRPAPLVGQDTVDVLEGANLSRAEIDSLLATGAAKQSEEP